MGLTNGAGLPGFSCGLPRAAAIAATVYAFKFTPVNDGCTKFTVNAQTTIRSAAVTKCRPDGDFGGAVLCRCFETRLERVGLTEPCAMLKNFVACLKPCTSGPTQATGRTFFRILYPDDKIWFMLTDKGLKDVTKATIQVAGMDVVRLTGPDEGDCGGLLVGACFYPKDLLGPWKGKSLGEIVKAIEAGQATVLVCTKQYPAGEISGKIEEP